jgi:hypothetical protein
MSHSTTTSVHTKTFYEDIELDKGWNQYLFKHPNQAILYYNSGYPVVC